MSKMAHSVDLRQVFLPPGTWERKRRFLNGPLCFMFIWILMLSSLSLVWNIVVILTFSKKPIFYFRKLFYYISYTVYLFSFPSSLFPSGFFGFALFPLLKLNAHLICFKPYFLPVPLSLYIFSPKLALLQLLL